MADVSFMLLRSTGLALRKKEVIPLYIFSNKMYNFISLFLYMQKSSYYV